MNGSAGAAMTGDAQDGKPGIAWAKVSDDKQRRAIELEQSKRPRPVIAAERIATALYEGKPVEVKDDAGQTIVFKMDHRGAVLWPARVEVDLDLTALVYEKPIDLSHAEFSGTVTLKNARTGALDFDRSTFETINAEGLKTGGDIRINAATINRQFILEKSVINGDVWAEGLRINPDKGDLGNLTALFAQQARIQGSVLLSEGFSAEGRVAFNSAKVGGQFSCSNGSFKNPDGDALQCQAIDVTGSVFLSWGFSAEGVVEFNSAKVGG
ncbi:MAG: hypothetical protein HXY22_09595 [Alphaproteobacteria bacterium]|nr:hypothetical protein [Alphaproteobacteria bacterium]